MESLGKIDTNTLLLIGVAAVGVYMLTRPTTPAPVPVQYYAPTALQQAQAAAQSNPVAADISASGTALEGLISLIGNFF